MEVGGWREQKQQREVPLALHHLLQSFLPQDHPCWLLVPGHRLVPTEGSRYPCLPVLLTIGSHSRGTEDAGK